MTVGLLGQLRGGDHAEGEPRDRREGDQRCVAECEHVDESEHEHDDACRGNDREQNSAHHEAGLRTHAVSQGGGAGGFACRGGSGAVRGIRLFFAVGVLGRADEPAHVAELRHGTAGGLVRRRAAGLEFGDA